MKDFLKLLFRTGVNNNNPKSNLIQLLVCVPLFLLMIIIWQKLGISYFVGGVTVLGVLTIISWLWSRS